MRSTGLSTAVTALSISPCSSYIFAGVGPYLRVYASGKRNELLEWHALDRGVRIYGIDCWKCNDRFVLAICGGRAFRVAALKERDKELCVVVCGDVCRTNDWIWNVKFLQEQMLCVAKSHATIEFWRTHIRESISIEGITTVSCSENELTWCTGLWSDEKSLVAGAGTSFGDIILWRMEIHMDIGIRDEAARGLRIKGHQGPVMRVVFSENGQWLASASVDRTVRVWRKSRSAERDNVEYSILYTHFGHLGRVWDVAFCNGMPGAVASVAEDRTCRLWKGESGAHGRILLQGHSGSLWSIAASDGYLVTGGEDGVIKVHDSKRYQNRAASDRFSFTCHLPKDNSRVQKNLGSAKDEAVRCMKIVGSHQVLLATDLGRVIFVSLPEANGRDSPKWSVLYRHHHHAAFSPHTLQILNDHVFVGAVDGSVTIIQVTLSHKEESLDVLSPNVTVFEAFRREKRMVMGLFVQRSCGSGVYQLYVASPHGVLFLWNFNSVTRSVQLVVKYCQESPPKTSLVTAVLFAQEANTLLVGDRGGRLLGYSLSFKTQNGSSLLKHADDVEIVHPSSIKRFHRDRVSQLVSFQGVRGGESKKHSVMYFSVGYDGLICQLNLNTGMTRVVVSHRLTIRMDTITRLVLPVCQKKRSDLLNTSYMFVSGFRGADFVVWDTRAEVEVLRERCGNWHRPFDLHLQVGVDGRNDSVVIDACTFGYWRSGELHVVGIKPTDGDNENEREQQIVQSLGSCCHGLRANDVKWIKNCWEGNYPVLITAGEDTDIRVTKVFNTGRIGNTVQTLTEHTSGVTCVAPSRLKDGMEILFSGAGMNELFCWMRSAEGPWTLCGKNTRPRSGQSKDNPLTAQHRITCVAALASLTDSSAQAVFGTSEGLFGLGQLRIPREQEDAVVNPIKVSFAYSHHSGSIISLSVVENDEGICFAVTGDTVGTLIIWAVCKVGAADKLALRSNAHQNGINSVSAIALKNSRVLVVTGGDDESLKIFEFDTINGTLSNASVAPRRHSGAITSVSIFQVEGGRILILSTGADQKLICLELCIVRSANGFSNFAFKDIDQGLVSVTDPSSLDVLADSCKVRIAVSGCGIESVELSVEDDNTC